MAQDRARSPRGLFCHVQAKEEIEAPTKAPIHDGMNGMFPPTALPTKAILINAYIILKSGSREDRGTYFQGFRAGGKGRGPPRLLPLRRNPKDAATYLHVG